MASEFRLRDAWKAEAVGTIYVIFNITYYCLAPLGEKLIYYILDWGRKPLVAVAYSALTLFVLVPVFTALHYGIYRSVDMVPLPETLVFFPTCALLVSVFA